MNVFNCIVHTHLLKKIALAAFFIILIHLQSAKTIASENISLELTPSIQIVNLLHPGEEKTITYSLTNHSRYVETVTIELFPIKSIDKNTNRLIYQPKDEFSKAQQSFYLNAISFSYQDQLVSEIIIPPKQTREVEARITYDPNQSQSEYYMTIGFLATSASNTPKAKDEEIQASTLINGGIGSHLLVSLGERIPDVSIENLHPLTSSSSTPDISFLLRNTADKSTKLYGRISITNILGVEIASLETGDIFLLGNQTKEVLISSKELESNDLAQTLSLGVNKITLSLIDTTSAKRVTSEATFLYIPTKQIIIFLAIAFSIALLYRRVKKKLS